MTAAQCRASNSGVVAIGGVVGVVVGVVGGVVVTTVAAAALLWLLLLLETPQCDSVLELIIISLLSISCATVQVSDFVYGGLFCCSLTLCVRRQPQSASWCYFTPFNVGQDICHCSLSRKTGCDSSEGCSSENFTVHETVALA